MGSFPHLIRSGFCQWDLFHAGWIRAFPMGSACFWWGSQSWRLGRTNFPAGWEVLKQLMDRRDVAVDGCDIVAIDAYRCVFLGTQDWGAALAVGCRQDLTFLQKENACAGFA